MLYIGVAVMWGLFCRNSDLTANFSRFCFLVRNFQFPVSIAMKFFLINVGINKIKTISKQNNNESHILNGLKIGNENNPIDKIKNIQVNAFLFKIEVNRF